MQRTIYIYLYVLIATVSIQNILEHVYYIEKNYIIEYSCQLNKDCTTDHFILHYVYL